MFRGRFEHTVDAKGRVSIPAKYRELLAEKSDNCIMVTNFDRCLMAFPLDEWQVWEEKVTSMSMVKKEATAFQRFFISGAQECAIDKLGRILIPPTLRSYGKLEKNVVFVGLGKRFELWSKERWEEELSRSQENFEGMREALSELGL